MGKYFNPGVDAFKKALNSEIYIDKTGLINYTNNVLNKRKKNICVSSPDRFGKSTLVAMLAAYYSCGYDSGNLFSSLEISTYHSNRKFINQYNTIVLNINDFWYQSSSVENMIEILKSNVIWELNEKYPDCCGMYGSDFFAILKDIYHKSKCPFVFIIDEWDCVYDKKVLSSGEENKYYEFLKECCNKEEFIHLTYLTGKIPLNNTKAIDSHVDNFSMAGINPLASYIGFTEREVRNLCEKYKMNYKEIKEFYAGYPLLKEQYIYCPDSVIKCMLHGKIASYWEAVEAVELLRYITGRGDGYINKYFWSLAYGRSIPADVNVNADCVFSLKNESEILLFLVYKGLLAYNEADKSVYIPNKEVRAYYLSVL